MHEKQKALKQKLQDMAGVLVAFSGGVDSTFLLWSALDALGAEQVLAVTAESPICFRQDLARAAELADRLGARHRIVATTQMQDPRFVRNDPRRCYYCKRHILSRLMALTDQEGLAWVVEGSNQDDAGEYRPGALASQELGVRSPLQEVGLTKDEIRALSRQAGLATWDQPSQTCLATRFAHDVPITIKALAQVERAEALLRELGFGDLRVRHHGTMARIELPAAKVSRLTDPKLAARVVDELKRLGFRYVTLDLEGYRRGSLEVPVTQDGE